MPQQQSVAARLSQLFAEPIQTSSLPSAHHSPPAHKHHNTEIATRSAMPPNRTISSAKVPKTERTHEENQERAYIAASRRSDRSLEARIESARRASEIHKKRTGRALRVTEQDVANEEMYEEVDDDLPSQFRRLHTFAHLQTGSIDFNRRLQAYMSSQMAMRNALIERSNFVQAYSSPPFFANPFAPPMQPTMLPPQMFHYPNPGFSQPQNFTTEGGHHRSTSMTTPQDVSNYMNQSTPVTPLDPQFGQDVKRQISSPQLPGRPSASRTTSSASLSTKRSTSPHVKSESQDQDPAMSTTGMGLPTTTGALMDSAQSSSFAPFSTSLPTETQQLLVAPPFMAESNPYNHFWFPGIGVPVSYSYKPHSFNMQTTSQSADPTLSMAHVDTTAESPTSVGGHAVSANAHSYGYGYSDSLFPDPAKPGSLTRMSSSGDSGSATP